MRPLRATTSGWRRSRAIRHGGGAGCCSDTVEMPPSLSPTAVVSRPCTDGRHTEEFKSHSERVNRSRHGDHAPASQTSVPSGSRFQLKGVDDLQILFRNLMWI